MTSDAPVVPPSADKRRPRGFFAAGSPWPWLVSLFCFIVGAKLWLIGRFGMSMPFWDHWEEAATPYMPYFGHHLTLADLITPHNEHRPLFTRLYALVLLLLNGEWDAQLQMVGCAFIHSCLITGLGWVVSRLTGPRVWPWLWFPLAAVVALPFAWENTLGGFHSMFFFMLLFSLPTLWLLGLYPAWSARWWLGGLAGFCSLFNVGSGFIASAAVFALVALKIFKRRDTWKQHLPTLVVCVAWIGAGAVLLRVDVPHHHVLMAHSPLDFLISFGNALAWPWIVLPPVALVNFLPLLALGWFYLRSRETSLPAEELTLALGFWTIISAAASAYARGAGGALPQWRYMDTTSFALTTNAIAILILLTRYRGRTWLGRFEISAAFGWALMNALGLFLLTSRAWQLDLPERDFLSHAQLKGVRAFILSGEPHYLCAPERAQRAMFYPERLIWMLDDANIRSRLPASVRDPLKVVPAAETNAAFTARGWNLRKADPPTEVSWGSYNSQGAAAEGTFKSKPVQASRYPYLDIEVAGDLGEPGLSLELVDAATGNRTKVKPKTAPGPQWTHCQVKAPKGEFTVVASDNRTDKWFAFKEPRELGRLSEWAIRAMRNGPRISLVGLVLFCVATLLNFRPRKSVPVGVT